MNIYIDILIIENIIVNLFLLSISYKILKIKYDFKKAIIISILSGLYSITMLFNELILFSKIPFQLGVGFIMCYFPLIDKNFKKTLKCFFTFLIVSFVLSGLCFKFMINSEEYVLVNGILISNFSIKYLMLGVILIFITLERITTNIRERNIITNFFYEVKLKIKDEEVNLNGFLDSGNELREPITNLPCILVEDKFINVKDIDKSETYYVPYKAVGYEGRLLGVKADYVVIRRENDDWKRVDAIICICSDKLSNESDFNALLSRGVL